MSEDNVVKKNNKDELRTSFLKPVGNTLFLELYIFHTTN